MLTSDDVPDVHQLKSGRVDSQSAGTSEDATRIALEAMVGQVLPSAWNIDEQLKITPFAAKFHELIISICTPTRPPLARA
jgi:hypothetical protein